MANSATLYNRLATPASVPEMTRLRPSVQRIVIDGGSAGWSNKPVLARCSHPFRHSKIRLHRRPRERNIA